MKELELFFRDGSETILHAIASVSFGCGTLLVMVQGAKDPIEFSLGTIRAFNVY